MQWNQNDIVPLPVVVEWNSPQTATFCCPVEFLSDNFGRYLAFLQISKRTMEKAIASEMSGDLKDGMLAIGKSNAVS